MTSKDVLNYLQNEGIDKLYKKYESVFNLIDELADKLVTGDLLNEFELAQLIDRATGVYAKLAPVSGALEAIMSQTEYNTEIKEYSSLEKVKTSDNPVIKAKARASVNDLRRYFSDFNSYTISAEKLILSGQSRLKRLTVESGAKGVSFTGETPVSDTTKKGW
jgi:hypothetical protein